jgi:hypothetical protein
VRRDHLFKVAWVVAGLVFAPSRAEAYRPFDGTDADVAEVERAAAASVTNVPRKPRIGDWGRCSPA